MNKNLNIAFRRRSGEQGFALPIAVAMGLIMILISSTLLVRSQNDRVVATAQKETARSLSLSEVGVTRTLSLFKTTADLTSKQYNPTASPVVDEWTLSLGASASSFLGAPANDRWIPLSTFGHFKIDSYTLDPANPGIGTLVVSGKTSQEAITSLEVKIGYDLPAITKPELKITSWQRKKAP